MIYRIVIFDLIANCITTTCLTSFDCPENMVKTTRPFKWELQELSVGGVKTNVFLFRCDIHYDRAVMIVIVW